MPKLAKGKVQMNVVLREELKDELLDWIYINYGTLVPVSRAIEDIFSTITAMDGALWDQAREFRKEVDRGNSSR